MASKQGIPEELMHSNSAKVVNGSQDLDIDATHSETQGTQRENKGSYDVLQEGTPHLSEMLEPSQMQQPYDEYSGILPEAK